MPIRNRDIRWKFPDLVEVPGNYQLSIGGSSLVSETLYRRGFKSIQDARAFLNPDLFKPSPSSDLPGLSKAANRLAEIIETHGRVLIWGDFDVDGQTSTALLFSALKTLGADTFHHIPIRSVESHGVTIPVLSQKIQEVSPDLILTCDTGIDASAAVAFANERGVDVIITDHHQLPPSLPAAYAIVNPNMLDLPHPLSTLPGVGVAYKLVEEIYSFFDEDPTVFLDLVALGIVADVAVQTGDTRYLLQRGLDVLRNVPRPGLLEMYNTHNLSPSQVTEEQIGFLIGPRLNALGRLDDANSCVDFFTTQDQSTASFMASRLESLNKDRQRLTEEIFKDAINMVDSDPVLNEEYPILVLQGPPSWHPGVIGIVASRLVERFHKPVIMLSQDGDFSRGSARSIPGVPIASLIGSCDDILASHGGHPMAAGMSLPAKNIPQFRLRLKDNFHQMVGDSLPPLVIQIDSELSFDKISEKFVLDFQRLAPFGAGNPKLTFAARGVFIQSPDQVRLIGRENNHRKITFTDSNGDSFDFLWWNSASIDIPSMPIDITYSLDISTYKGQTQVQATLQNVRQSPGTPVYLPKDFPIKIVDLRDSPTPLADIQNLPSSSSSTIWAEWNRPEDLPSKPRNKLPQADRLIVWTTPANRQILNSVVKKVSPKEIVIIGIDPPMSSLEDFIQALLGLLKHMKRTGKSFDLSLFSQALAMPDPAIELGLEWIRLHGDYNLEGISDGLVLPGSMKVLPGFEEVDRKLKEILREIIAYRHLFSSLHTRVIL